MIENYVKNTNCISANRVKVPRLPQFKSYLKIIGIPFLQENTNIPINSSIVEDIIKKNHIFNNIICALIPLNVQIVKANIKWTQTYVLSGNTTSTRTGIIRSSRNFMIVEAT